MMFVEAQKRLIKALRKATKITEHHSGAKATKYVKEEEEQQQQQGEKEGGKAAEAEELWKSEWNDCILHSQ